MAKNQPEPIILTEGETGATSEWVGHLVELRACHRVVLQTLASAPTGERVAATYTSGWEGAAARIRLLLEERFHQILAACPEKLDAG